MATLSPDGFVRDGTLLAGGALAILLQVAHPVVGAAVAEHSDFSRRPLARFRNTMMFVYGVTLGTPDEAHMVARRVGQAHSGVSGANDERYQLWVAATLYFAAVTVHERVFGPIGDAAASAVLRRYAPLATSLGVPPALWPSSPSEFAEFFAGARRDLRVGRQARSVARDLFRPAVAPWWLRAVLPSVAVLTASMLEPSLRRDFGFRWSFRHERRADAAWRALRVAVRFTPRYLREWPSRYFVNKLRAMAAS